MTMYMTTEFRVPRNLRTFVVQNLSMLNIELDIISVWNKKA